MNEEEIKEKTNSVEKEYHHSVAKIFCRYALAFTIGLCFMNGSLNYKSNFQEKNLDYKTNTYYSLLYAGMGISATALTLGTRAYNKNKKNKEKQLEDLLK